MPGPQPIPTKILEARGSWRAKERIAAGEPSSLSASVPKCPGGLSKGAKAEWTRIIPLIQSMKHTTDADLSVIEGYCVYYDGWRAALRAIKKFEVGSIERRRVEISGEAAYRAMLTAAAKLGFSPSDRSKAREISAAGSNDKKEIGKARFFQGPRLADAG